MGLSGSQRHGAAPPVTSLGGIKALHFPHGRTSEDAEQEIKPPQALIDEVGAPPANEVMFPHRRFDRHYKRRTEKISNADSRQETRV